MRGQDPSQAGNNYLVVETLAGGWLAKERANPAILKGRHNMTLKQGTAWRQSTARQRCCHYWVIEPANGGTSKGVCRFCDEERLFNNYLHAYGEEGGEEAEDWNDNKPAPKPVRVKGRQTENEKGSQATCSKYTKEDFRRWGKLGGRGNRKRIVGT